jgi:hypothetical protein
VLVTFGEAAAMIGQRSRGTLYRWLADGLLDHAGYLRGTPGRWRIETDPPGLRPFRDWARGVLGPQGPMRQADRMLTLPKDAQFAGDGNPHGNLDKIKVSEMKPRELPPPAPAADPWEHIPERLRSVDGSPPFWAEFGRIAPAGEELTDEQFWANVHAIVQGMMGRPLGLSPAELADIHFHLSEAVEDVVAGARWDGERWDEASVQLLIDDGPCSVSVSELARMLADGRVPEHLLDKVEADIAAHGQQ